MPATPAHILLARLLARQAVRRHLRPRDQQPRDIETQRSKRAVQSAPDPR